MIFNIKVIDTDERILKELTCTIKETVTPETPQETYGFSEVLNLHRNKIDKIDADVWKKVRWYINEYDFQVKDPIINRAFYKYWEIVNVFNVFENFTETDTIFHCAEAPGGFIQGSNMFLQLSKPCQNRVKPTVVVDDCGFTTVSKKNKYVEKKYKIFTISLNKDLSQYKDYNLPSYNKRVLNRNVCVTYGKDNTGDINNKDNVDHIKHLVGPNGCYLITADGGFDEGTDFNNKEQLHYLLILNEICSSISVQKKGGVFVLKVFDIFTSTSINLLYLLNLLYKELYIYKPKTSRPTNSEKYIVCKNFVLNDDILRDQLTTKLHLLSNKLKSQKHKYNSFTLFDSIPLSFVKNIKYMNTYLLGTQCNHLVDAIQLSENETFIKNYDSELEHSLDKRRKVFKNWEKAYKLNDYITS